MCLCRILTLPGSTEEKYDVGNWNVTVPNYLSGLQQNLNFSISGDGIVAALTDTLRWAYTIGNNSALGVAVVFGLPILTVGLSLVGASPFLIAAAAWSVPVVLMVLLPPKQIISNVRNNDDTDIGILMLEGRTDE